MRILFVLLTITFSTLSSAQSSLSYSPGDSRIIQFGNGEEGFYSGSFLSPVGQGAAGKDPKEVKTEFGFGSYNGKTAFQKGDEAKKSDEEVMDLKYKNQVYSLFKSDYFPSQSWNGTPLVEKVYSIMEGINGDQSKAKKNANNHRLFNPTNINDLVEWDKFQSEEELKKAYREKYRVLMGQEPSQEQVGEFYLLFNAIKNAVPWSGLCHQFSAANANPYFNKTFENLYSRQGEVYLCQKPITLGEIKEATTLLYDSVSFSYDSMLGGKINFMPDPDPLGNMIGTESLDFLKKYPPNTFIEAKDLDVHRSQYSSYVYKNYFDRLGKNPSGLGFCDLDQRFSELERQDYGDSQENAMKNKVPIMNLAGNGEIWNNAVTGVTRDVHMYNVYDGNSMTTSGVGASNSFATLMQLYADKKSKNETGTDSFKRLQKLLVRNTSIMCKYAIEKGMTLSQSFCNQITNNQVYNVPVPGGTNMDQWSSMPKLLAQRNAQVDDAVNALVMSFMVFDSESKKPVIDAQGLPRMRSTDSPYFEKMKLQNISLKVDYIAQSDFADTEKGAKKSDTRYDGIVVVDESVSPVKQVGCSWKNVWSYNANLKKYEGSLPASFMTLDIPECPQDSKAQTLLDKVQQCATFKEFLSEYNAWMLEASQGMDLENIKQNIADFRKKYPETNVDWTKLESQVVAEMNASFVEESKE